jgi:DNA-binding transcriptional MerR regulator
MYSTTVQEVHVGAAAEAVGVTARYLRLLEAGGAIPPARRDEHGFRVYSDADVERLREIGVGSRPHRLKRPEEVRGG